VCITTKSHKKRVKRGVKKAFLNDSFTFLKVILKDKKIRLPRGMNKVDKSKNIFHSK